MRKYFRCLVYLIAIVGFSSGFAGSYDDFFIAIKRDDAKSINALLNRGFDANTPGPDGSHGLLLALREPALAVAEALIAWPKTNVEARTPQDESPLMLAALKGNAPLASKLVARGADVNKEGWTPLHYAATAGNLEVIKLLLDNHAYIDAESPNGTTPLMMAAHYGTPAATKLLLDQGADARLKNKLGLTAIDFANRASRKDSADLIAGFVRNSQPKGKW